MNFSFWFLSAAVIIFLTYVQWWLRSKKLRAFNRKYAGPRGWPLLGILPEFIHKNGEEILRYIMELIGIYGTPVSVWVGPVLLVVVDHPEHLKAVLNSSNCLQKPYVYDFLNVKYGLMTGPGKWLSKVKESFWVSNSQQRASYS